MPGQPFDPGRSRSDGTTPGGLGLRGRQVVCATPEQAARALADQLADHLDRRLGQTNVVHLALSGGSSGALLCDVLAADKRLDQRAWKRVHLWMVDERCVPDNDPRLNFALIRDRLAPLLDLPGNHLHPMPVMVPDGAASYERQLQAALSQEGPATGRLDAIVLGMGPDGHTASLFPNSPALEEPARWVVINDGDTVVPPRPRMTMTYPALAQARLIFALVTGASKRPALTALASGTSDFHSLPVSGVVPVPDSRMVWFLDRAAWPGAAADDDQGSR